MCLTTTLKRVIVVQKEDLFFLDLKLIEGAWKETTQHRERKWFKMILSLSCLVTSRDKD